MGVGGLGEREGEREGCVPMWLFLCVAQIVLFSGKVETQHCAPEVWLPGERGGKEWTKRSEGGGEAGGVERATERKARERLWDFGQKSWKGRQKLRKAGRDREPHTEIRDQEQKMDTLKKKHKTGV